MDALLNKMSILLHYFVQKERLDRGVLGIIVFGSFVKGNIHVTSDLDLFVLRGDINGRSRIVRRDSGIILEVYIWPHREFQETLLGKRGNLFLCAFLFEVLRTGIILYDPHRIIKNFKKYVESHTLPSSHLKLLVRGIDESLSLAQELLEKEELEGAEIELRKCTEDLARAILLENDVLEINPPKTYLPHLRRVAPNYYMMFRKAHNLIKIDRKEVEGNVQVLKRWCERAAEHIHWVEEGHGLRECVSNAQSELSHAQECLEDYDLEAATLQVRHSALFLMSFILNWLKRPYYKAPSKRMRELCRVKSSYGSVLRYIMKFSYDKDGLERLFIFLKKFARYRFRSDIKGEASLPQKVFPNLEYRNNR